jgi:hypothetical protein
VCDKDFYGVVGTACTACPYLSQGTTVAMVARARHSPSPICL